MRLLCITRQANLSHSAVACSTISCLLSWQTYVPKLLHHPNLNSSAYLQVTEREITLMWILLWQNWCSRLLRARNVMKKRHDMEWHSHTQSLYDTIFISSFFGGSSSGRLSKKIYEFCWWEIGEVGPFNSITCCFHFCSVLDSFWPHFISPLALWAYLNSQIRISIHAILFLLIIIHSCIPALGWPKTAQSVHCCSRSAILLRFCLKTYKP